MYQSQSVNSPSESKTQAAFRLKNLKQKLRRTRRKRELIDRPFLETKDVEDLSSTIRGTEGWAKLVPGSIKIVKRYIPQEESHHDV